MLREEEPGRKKTLGGERGKKGEGALPKWGKGVGRGNAHRVGNQPSPCSQLREDLKGQKVPMSVLGGSKKGSNN